MPGRIEITLGDITEQVVDAIVNAANAANNHFVAIILTRLVTQTSSQSRRGRYPGKLRVVKTRQLPQVSRLIPAIR